MTLGERVRDERKKRHWSQDTLAKKSGVSQGMISLIERGVNAPTTETLVPIANALGIPIASIMGEPAPAPTPPADEAHQLYDSLNDQDKEKALEYMRFILSQRKKG